MQIICTPQEAIHIRHGLKSFIKSKRGSINNIERHMAEDPVDSEVNEIRRLMLERRKADIESARKLLADLENITVEE